MGNKLGSVYQQLVSKSADYTVQDADDLVLVDASGGAVTITLPTPLGRYPAIDGRGLVRIVKTDSSANPVTVTPAAGSIVGQAVLRNQNQSAEFQSDGIDKYYNFGPRVTLFQVRVALSAAEIIAMNATPKILIPAPGAGKAIVVDNVLFKMNRTATAFTGGGALSIQYTSGGADVAATIAASVVTTGGAGTEYNNVRGQEATLTPTQNTSIEITNATAAFATGTGTAEVIIDYHLAE